MPQYESCVPAYGRDYKSKKAVMEAWNENKDFQMQPSGQYINKTGFELQPRGSLVLNVRFKNLTQICVIR